MRIPLNDVIDAVTGLKVGEVVIHTELAPHITHPDYPGKLFTVPEIIAMFKDDPDLRERAGWNDPTRLMGEANPISAWDRLVAHTSSENGCPLLKAVLNKDGK